MPAWSATSLLYKIGVRDVREERICLKYSACVGLVFFAIALGFLIYILHSSAA